MVNFILQQWHQKLLERQLTFKNDYQDWIQWVEIKEKERSIGPIIKSPPFI
jgi:hypothetical protein